MQDVVIEFKGAFRRVNREQLATLVEKGYVSAETRMKIDGRECTVGSVVKQIEANAEVLDPAMSSVSDSSPFDERPMESSRLKTILFNDDPFGTTTDKEFKAAKPSGAVTQAPVAPPKSNRSLVIILCAVVGVLTLSVVILSIALTVGDGAREAAAPSEEAATSDAPVETGPVKFTADRTEPFDASAELIDPGYRGVDVEDLFNGLEKFWKFEKDEFETTDEFNARVEKAVGETSTRSVLGNISFSSTIALPLDNYEQEYDADNQKLSFKFKALTNLKPKYRRPGTPTLEVYRSEKAWTKKVNVTRVRSRQVEGVTRTAYSIGARSPFDQQVVLDMPQEEARALKGNTLAFVVFKLDYVPIDGGYTSIESGEYDGPGLDQYAVTENFILVKELEFWVCNKTTGEIVVKRPLIHESDAK